MEALDNIIKYAKDHGIMFTLRYVVERDTFAAILHLDKGAYLDAAGPDLTVVLNTILHQISQLNFHSN